jgi:Large ribosomal RNA subunit accumulation protein YceD
LGARRAKFAGDGSLPQPLPRARGPAMSEFARPYALDKLGDRPVATAIEASDAERAALAARFGVLAIARLTAKFKIRRARAGRAVRLEGAVEGEVTQACVVSLAPVRQTIREKFVTLYVPEADLKPIEMDEAGAVSLDAFLGDEELEEALPDGPLDLGEIAAQEFAVAIDPYPRADGAGFKADWGAGAPLASPFADLKAKLGKREE